MFPLFLRSQSLYLLYSTVPKPDGGIRLILNLKELNTYVKYFHFKMETVKTVLQNITEGCFMTCFDLKDAYFSVKIHDDYQKYLKFRWEKYSHPV